MTGCNEKTYGYKYGVIRYKNDYFPNKMEILRLLYPRSDAQNP